NNYAIKGIAFANEKKCLPDARLPDGQGKHIITSPIEHHAVLEPLEYLEGKGFRITKLAVDKYGLIDLEDLSKVITKDTVLVSIMHANNEIGTIEPIKEIGEVIRRRTINDGRKIVFHTDAVQSFGYLPINVGELNIDLMSVSAHKFYGPKGIGFLYIRDGIKLVRFMDGGAQEFGKRASTHNVPGIVGLGKAVELLAKEREAREQHVIMLRDKLIKEIHKNIPDVLLTGHPGMRLPNNASFCIKNAEGESMLINLDLEGIAVSSGSACSSGSLEPSHVLKAIGTDPILSHGSLRFTFGRDNSEKDIDRLMVVLPKIVNKIRKMSPLSF
ncbi:MAG: cysteine desulfurase family protein, partial [bacterium]